jgi:hypothetical protein
MKKCGFAFTRRKTLHFLQWMQKQPKQHHEIQFSPHYGHSEGGESLKKLIVGLKCNGSDQESKGGEA